MSDEQPNVPHVGPSPLVNSKSALIDDILRFVDRAPDEETERFVAAIYADRQGVAAATQPIE